METAASLRTETLKARDRLSPEAREEKNRAIHEKFFQIINKIPSETIFIYVSYRSEVGTDSLITQLLDAGKIVTVPLVQVNSRKMLAIRLMDPENDLVSGYYGIMEPKESLIQERTLDPSRIDVVVLPGSVFDERGGRMGYGGGFYDTFLAMEVLPSAKRIAFSYDLQIKHRIPQQAHDQPVDFVISEKRLIQGERESKNV